jgi:hypothetical protein
MADVKPSSPSFSISFNGPAWDGLPDSCHELVTAIVTGASHPHPAFQCLVASHLAALTEQARPWLHGQLNYPSTEAWRAAYELVLNQPNITEYRSVAWVKTEDYWQDLPGQHAMQFNYALLDRGMKIERAFILGWNLWPPELALPDHSIRSWIEEQHYRGVEVWLVRETELVCETGLLCDFGIYGDEATGQQELDEASRTICYTLSFDPSAIRLAKDRWVRLALFAQSYADLLDRAS